MKENSDLENTASRLYKKQIRYANDIKEVSRSSLPMGIGFKVDGIYNTSKRFGEVDETLTQSYKTFVKAHEYVHSLGITDEKKADELAAALTGHSRFIRGPFYQPLLKKSA